MSTFITTTRRRDNTAPTASRTQPNATPSFIFASDGLTAIPFPSDAGSPFIELDTSVPTPRATIATTTKAATSVQTCAVDSDCTSGRTCANQVCVGSNDAAPLGGADSEPTSHLSAGSAIGIVLGVLALISLLSAIGFFFWRRRPKPLPKDSIEAPSNLRDRSASSATGRTIENDQKTLVGSPPTSPQNARFNGQNEMAPELFAKAFEFDGNGKEIAVERRKESLDDTRSLEAEKALPPAPTDAPLPPPPADEKRYALNVNIDKSMMFDEDMSRAVSPAPESGTATPRERGPRYRFEEYLPPVTKTPPISITQRPMSSKQSSEYELERYPTTRSRSGTASTADNGTYGEPGFQGVRDEALSQLESMPPQLPPPEMPPPSPSFSFRSYDWYQDIIGDQNPGSRTPSVLSPSPARTPTQPTFLHRSSNLLDINASLFPEPPSHLHPNTAALPSPTTQSFRLSSNVYEAPSPLPKLPPIPPTSIVKQSRVSTLSTTTKKTHNSRSWLPEEGLYLPEDGSEDSFKRFRRPSDASRPMSYSPLT